MGNAAMDTEYAKGMKRAMEESGNPGSVYKPADAVTPQPAKEEPKKEEAKAPEEPAPEKEEAEEEVIESKPTTEKSTPETNQDAESVESNHIPESNGKRKSKKAEHFNPNESPEKIFQKYKTIDGMWKSELKRKSELEKELSELKAQLESSKKAEPDAKKEEKTSSMPDFTAAINALPKVQKLKEMHGDEIVEAMTEAMSTTMKDLYENLSGSFENRMKIINANIAPIFEAYSRTSEESHVGKILDAHPDVLTVKDGKIENLYADEINSWIDSQPAYKRGAYRKAAKEGSSEEVIDLINDFKSATGFGTEDKSDEEPKQKKTMEKPPVKVAMRNSPVNVNGKAKGGTYEDGMRRAMAEG